MTAPPPNIGELLFMNVYAGAVDGGIRCTFPTKATADLYACSSQLRRVACVCLQVTSIIWETGDAYDKAGAGEVEPGAAQAAVHGVPKVRRAGTAMPKKAKRLRAPRVARIEE